MYHRDSGMSSSLDEIVEIAFREQGGSVFSGSDFVRRFQLTELHHPHQRGLGKPCILDRPAPVDVTVSGGAFTRGVRFAVRGEKRIDRFDDMRRDAAHS